MRTAGRIFVILTLVALGSSWVPSLFCARAGAPSMPCCKTQTPCDLQIKTNRCCAIERAAATPGTATGIPAPSSGAGQMKRLLASHTDLLAADIGSRFDPTRVDHLWYPPEHDRSAPLFLRNVSILR